MLAIKNVTLIDGTGVTPVENAVILVDNGIFTAVGPNIKIPSEAVVIDGTGKTVIPALSDAHTHLGGSDSFDYPSAGSRMETYSYLQARTEFLDWGVTTVRSCGDFCDDILSFRDDVLAGKIQHSPRVLCCGSWFQAPDGHPWGTVYMKSSRIAEHAINFITPTTMIVREVSSLVQRGVDFIKVFYGHLNKMDINTPAPRLTKDQLAQVILGAHQNRLKVAVHVDGPAEIKDALECGADSIEHLIGAGGDDLDISDELIAQFKESGAVLVPTMISILRFDKTPGFRSVWEPLKLAVKRFYDAGVPMAVGCDSQIPFVPAGQSLHDELSCLVEAGVSPMDAICMATMGNAKLFGMEHEIGSIEVGKKADLILLGSNPLDNIQKTKDIKLVLMDGRIIVDKMIAC